MRSIVVAAAALAAFAAAPAQALTKAQQDCPLAAFDAAFGKELGDILITDAPDKTRVTAMVSQIHAASDACAKQTALPEANWEDYFQYAFAVIPRASLRAQIAAAGIDVPAIDEVMGFGPGRANPTDASITDEQSGRIIDAQMARGVKIENVDPAVWNRLGGYVAATALMNGIVPKLP